MTRSPRRVAVIGLTVAFASRAACSSSKVVGGGEAASSTVAEATATSESSVPGTDAATTTGPTTTVAATTTTAAAPEPLVLRGDGIGEFALGAAAATVVDGLTEQLGPPASDVGADYPAADGLGQFTTADGETGFVAPLGRTVCWSMQFCAEFGGAAAESLSFTGWTYHDDSSTALQSSSGVTIGTRWSDAPEITADEGGCYSVGSGTVDGIRLTLESEGEPFGSFDDMGNYVIGAPAPADVTVIWMETGEVPIFLFGDC